MKRAMGVLLLIVVFLSTFLRRTSGGVRNFWYICNMDF